jgi:hypothetical protein
MNRRAFLGAAGGVTLLGGGYLGFELFAPEQATEVDEDRTGGAGTTDSGSASTTSIEAGGQSSDDEAGGQSTNDGGVTVLKRGEFVGKDGHECSGTVELARDEDGYFLQFTDYEQTQGPDVYCYVTPAPDPDTSDEIDAGRKVLVDGGADDGELTKTGTFAQSLPDAVDVDAASGVGAWCDDFGVPFGAATLDGV